MSKKSDFFDIMKWFSIVFAAGAGGGLGTLLLLDAQENHFAKMSDGLPLLVDGIHMKQGEHKFVITDNFYKLLSYDTPEEDQKVIMNSLKEAYTTLDNYNSKLNFKLCTTVDDVAKKFDIQKIDSIGKQDVPLYLTEGILDNNKNVLAHTNWNYDLFNLQMKDLSIVIKKSSLSLLWQKYDTVEETLSPKNTAAYTIAVHESMHAMGFKHIDDHKSIMNTYTNSTSPKDLTDYDIELLDKYNVQFYNSESTIKKASDYTTTATYTNTENELAM